MNIKLALISILIFGMSHLPTQLFAAADTYYVTQYGKGARSGESLSNAWSVPDFNSSANWSAEENSRKIDPGDTVYFSGTITSKVDPQGSGASGNYVTLDGLESGDYDAISEGSDGQTVIDLTEWYTANFGIRLNKKSYLIIQDFEIKKISHGIYSNDCSNVIIRRSFIHDGGSNGLYFRDSNYITIGGSSGNGCSIKNIGAGTAGSDIVFSGSHDFIVSYNHLYATKSAGLSTDRGIDGIVPMNASYNFLIEYNSIHDHRDNYWDDPWGSCGSPCEGKGEDGIDIKDDNCGAGEWSDGTYNGIIRYNHIYNNHQANIVVQSCTYNIYAYGNNIHESNWNSLYIMEGAGGCKNPLHDIFYFSNLSYKEGDTAVRIHSNSGGTTTDFYNIFVFNNTFAENATDGSSSKFCQITLHDQYAKTSTYIKNNIFYKSRTGYASNQELQLYFGVHFTDANLDYNRYYWPGKSSRIYIGGKYANAIDVGFVGIENSSTDGDPGLVDIANHDYRIASKESAVVDAGVDMGIGAIAKINIQGVVYPVYWDEALGPNTDWSGIIPSVEILRRDVLGWDIGAYALGNLTSSKKLNPPSRLCTTN